MNAGRELDALIAERVMGWQYCGPNDSLAAHKGRGGLILDTGPERFTHGILPVRWLPSTDIAAAWMVLEAMRARGVWLDVYTCDDHYEVHAKRAGEGDEEFTVHVGAESHPSISFAICRVALFALSAVSPEEPKNA